MRKTKTKSQILEDNSGLKCQYCGKDFKYESERKRHEQSHSPQFSCKVCNKKFSFVSALRRHEKQHERTGSVSCLDCNHKFRDESLLKRHIKYAHKGTFICSKCDATFSSDLALRCHIKIHKPESERRFRCSFEGCSKTFNFAHHLKHHELTHTNTKQHFCTICGKGFIQYHHLKSHIKTHEPENWLHCSIPSCKKTFSTVYALKRHLSTSTHKVVKDSTSDTDSVSADTKDTSSKVGEEYSALENFTIRSFSDSDFNESDTFGSCNQLDLREHLQYEPQYSGNETKIEHSKLYQKINEENDTIHNANSYEELPVSNCKSYLGGCIMEESHKTNHNCLCAQIEPNASAVKVSYFVEENIKPSVNAEENIVPELNSIKISNDCEGCHCKSSTDLNSTNATSKNVKAKCSNEIEDIIDYKPNGTIKIKEMSDIDLFISTSDKVKKTDGAESVPFNSCKAVLGTCIVSGNGIIGEGCLCAKMSMNDQPMLDYEIDELTPCPKT